MFPNATQKVLDTWNAWNRSRAVHLAVRRAMRYTVQTRLNQQQREDWGSPTFRKPHGDHDHASIWLWINTY